MKVQSQFIEMFANHATTPVGNFIKDSFPGEWGAEDNDDNGVKVIRTTNFTNTGKLDLTDVVTRSIIEKKVERKTIHKYDTILERSGGTTDNPVGRVVLFEEEGVYLCNNFTQVLRFKDIDPRFAFYSLYFFYQTNKIAVRAMGSKTTGIQNLNMNKYLEIGIPNASKEEQMVFVSIAEQADKSKFGSFKSQFIEMFGDESESKWNKVSVNNVFNLQMGKTPERGNSLYWGIGHKWISIADMSNFERFTENTKEFITDSAVKASGIKISPKGSVIMSFKLTIGRTAICTEDIYTNEAIMTFIDKKVYDLNVDFVQYYFSIRNWLSDAKLAVKGNTLNKESIGNSVMIIPDRSSQESFASILQQADKSKSVCRMNLS